jgi:hypothetical protein
MVRIDVINFQSHILSTSKRIIGRIFAFQFTYTDRILRDLFESAQVEVNQPEPNQYG